jgi:tetratricopeptide (TPR) repeat protein
MPELLSLVAAARAAAVDHEFDRAAELAGRILEAHPACLPALRVLAWAQLELGDDRALTTFERCAEIDPEDALAAVGQAIWRQDRDQTDLAIRHWVRAWELDPYNQAIRRALVKLTGELPESAFADGVGLLRQGRADEAADVLRRVAAVEPPDMAALLALLSALWPLAARRQAFNLALTVLAAHPHCVKALLTAALMEEAAGHTLRSRDLVARAEQVDPGFELSQRVVRELGLQAVIEPQRANRPVLVQAR